jgi:hypothetical protein
MSLVGVASPTDSDTYKVSCACTQINGQIGVATTNNGVGNSASTLVAVRVQ